MYYKATLEQALTQADSLIVEWQRLRRSCTTFSPDNRLQMLALRQLETELIDTLNAVRYRREQAKEQAEKEEQEQKELSATQ